MFFTASSAAASNPNVGSTSFNRYFTQQQTCNDWQSTGTNCVYQQTPLTNNCAWGDQDQMYDFANGKISSGQTATDTLCIVTDPCNDGACPHRVIFDAASTSNVLQASMSDDRGNVYLSNPVVKIGKQYHWRFCLVDPLYTGSQDLSTYPTIPGTGYDNDGNLSGIDGVGFVTNYTLTVKATKTTQFYAGFEVAPQPANTNGGLFVYLEDACS